MGIDGWSRVCAAALLALAVAGCGDDDGGDTPDAGPVAGTTAGTTAGTGGGGGAGSSASGTMATGGMAAGPMCDETIENVTMCGDTACGAIEGFAAMACTVNCCMDDGTCGVRNATMDMTTECMPKAQPDPRCPDYVGGTELPGCCTADNKCGFVSSISFSCITESLLLQDLAAMAGRDCDAPPETDAGTEDDGGA